MKVIIVAGTPGAGKTAVLLHTLKVLADEKRNVSAVKVDCLYTEDHLRFQNIGIPTLMGLSRDMCPDHYTIYNLGEMIDFANSVITSYSIHYTKLYDTG